MAVLVSAPRRQPRKGGLKSVLGEFVEERRLIVSQGGLAWEAADCGVTLAPNQAGCYDEVIEPTEKTGDEVALFTTIGEPFLRYAGVECYLGGDSVGDTFEQQARNKLAALEDRAVELVLWEWASAAPSPASTTMMVDAIASAEEYADDNYVGLPVLVMSRVRAQQAFTLGALVREGDMLVTGNGTPVISTGAVPDDDLNSVVIIGMPEVYASPVVARMAIAHTANLALAIAERAYALGVDCEFRHVVEFTEPGTGGGGGGGGGGQEVRSASDDDYNYVGVAPLGTAVSAEGWTVTRILLTDPDDVETAEGAWDDRETLVYS